MTPRIVQDFPYSYQKVVFTTTLTLEIPLILNETFFYFPKFIFSDVTCKSRDLPIRPPYVLDSSGLTTVRLFPPTTRTSLSTLVLPSPETSSTKTKTWNETCVYFLLISFHFRLFNILVYTRDLYSKTDVPPNLCSLPLFLEWLLSVNSRSPNPYSFLTLIT